MKNLIRLNETSNTDSIKFDMIDLQIAQNLSLENLIFKQEIFNKSNNKKSILKTIDFLSEGPQILIKNKKIFKTKFSGSMTMLALLLFIPITYYFAKDFFYNENPFINYSQNNLFSIDSNEAPDIPFMLSLTQTYANSTKLVWFTQNNVYPYLPLNYTFCTKEEMLMYNITEVNNQLNYYCSNYKYILGDLFTDLKNNISQSSFIYPANCSELYSYNIDNSTCINYSYPEFGSTVSFGFYILTKKFVNTYENFIVPDIATITFNETYTNALFKQNTFQQYLEYIQISNDNSKFFDNPINYYTAGSTLISQIANTFSSFNIPSPPAPNQRIFLINVMFNTYSLYINRVYIKFPQALTSVLSIITVLFIIIKLINDYIWEYLFTKYYSNDFIKSLDQDKINFILGQSI